MNRMLIITAVITMLASLAFIAFRLYRFNTRSPHAIAGAFGTFCLAVSYVLTGIVPADSPARMTQAAVLVVALAFFLLEVRLWRRDKSEIRGRQ